MGKAKKRDPEIPQIKVSSFAVQQIEDIIKYIAFVNQQPLNAVNVSEAFESTISKIEANPFAFKECEQLVTKTKIYRQAVCLSWLIIYRISASEILILNVIHSARRPSKIKALRSVK